MKRSLTRRGTLRSVLVTGTVATAGIGAVANGARAQSGYDGWFGDSTGGATDNYAGTVDETGSDEVTVTVGGQGNGGPYAFAPAAVRIDPGTTVMFEWISDNHNLVLQEGPDGGDWGGIDEIHNSGHEESHTFEAEGIYTYYCDPHLPLGMKGAIVVGDADTGESADAGSGGAGEDGGSGEGPGGEEILPGNDFGRIFLGIVLGTGLVAALAAFAPEITSSIRRLKTGTVLGSGGQAAVEEVSEAPAYEPPEEIGHHEYDPIGTARLILGYFLILVVLWVIMYFVEFLGNGPTVVG